jgi:hypothetical protein
MKILRVIVGVIAFHIAATGCTPNADFGRLRPSLVSDDMHAWVGKDAAASRGITPSTYPLTDDEREMRDLAFALIEPSFDRNRWYSVLDEYGLSDNVRPDWYTYDVQSYSRELMAKPFRSATARYAKINDDINDDIQRIGPFFMVAHRVLDIDTKREKSLAFVHVPEGGGNAKARMAENVLVVAWVQQSLADRAEAYRIALGRLVVETPTPMAVEVERGIAMLRQQIAQNHISVGPHFARKPRPVASVDPASRRHLALN